MPSVLEDILFPDAATTAGTQRVERIANEPLDQQIRDTGLSVIDAMLSAGRDKLVDAVSQTQTGQDIIARVQQNQLAQYSPLAWIVVIVIAFIVGAALFRGR